nr:pentapeptide repeat-containing protein [Armatimonas sp.]
MTPVTTTTTNTKTVFQTKAPLGVMKTRTFTVLATLLLIEGVMIGQVLSRPAAAKTGAAEDCNQISDELKRSDCWAKKAKAGDKNLRNSFMPGRYVGGADLSKADLCGARLVGTDLTKANLSGANLTGANLKGAILRDIIKDKDTKGLPPGS